MHTPPPTWDRRDFLKTLLAGTALGAPFVSAQETPAGGIPLRPMGKTGQKVSIVGLGGWDIGAVPDEKDAEGIMHEAIDQGLTFFDNCWDYHQGRSEERMGKALADGRRDKVFLMTKVCGRNAQTAQAHLEDSLRRLRTDRIDLWQFHGIKRESDAGLIFDEEDGALQVALKARQAGKIRFIGFTGHQDPTFHQAMLAQSFDWDAALMPLNLVDARYRSFQKEVMPDCVKRGIGVLGIKALGGNPGPLPKNLPYSAEICRRYVLSLPVTTVICGIQSRANLRQDLAIARDFKPMTRDELHQLAEACAPFAAEGKWERYKTGNYGCDWFQNQAVG